MTPRPHYYTNCMLSWVTPPHDTNEFLILRCLLCAHIALKTFNRSSMLWSKLGLATTRDNSALDLNDTGDKSVYGISLTNIKDLSLVISPSSEKPTKPKHEPKCVQMRKIITTKTHNPDEHHQGEENVCYL